METELWGILKGFEEACNTGFRKIQIESDCTEAIKHILRKNNNTTHAANLINECKNWLLRPWEVELGHTHREQNKVANKPAREALSHDREIRKMDSPPDSINRLFREDELGLLSPSVIIRA